MKTIRVVAAIILADNKIFATQRGYGEFKDGWEFPGGKIEPDETPEHAIIREIKEELDTKIEVIQLLDTVEYDYPKFHLSMDCFICNVKSGDLILKEHEAARADGIYRYGSRRNADRGIRPDRDDGDHL